MWFSSYILEWINKGSIYLLKLSFLKKSLVALCILLVTILHLDSW